MIEKKKIRVERTFSSTNTLRGIGIFAVLINHYANINLSGDYRGFANIITSLFFIMSGYGIYYSLMRNFKDNIFTYKNLIIFYYRRSLRLLPLFVLAMILESAIRSNFQTILMIPGRDYSGHYWFVSSIFQCYIISPLIYYLLSKNRIVAVVLPIFIFSLLSYSFNIGIVPHTIVNVLDKLHFDYRNIFFLHIIIFIISMSLPYYIENWSQANSSDKNYIISALTIFLLIILVSSKYDNRFQYINTIALETIFPIVLIFIVSIFIMKNYISFPALSFLGKISYPVYLFHGSVYYSIDKLFSYELNSVKELFITVFFISIFLFTCVYVQKIEKKVATVLKL